MRLSVDWIVSWFNFKSDSFTAGVSTTKEGRCMLTSEVVFMVYDIVKVERVNNTNNKVRIDDDNNSDGDRKE